MRRACVHCASGQRASRGVRRRRGHLRPLDVLYDMLAFALRHRIGDPGHSLIPDMLDITDREQPAIFWNIVDEIAYDEIRIYNAEFVDMDECCRATMLEVAPSTFSVLTSMSVLRLFVGEVDEPDVVRLHSSIESLEERFVVLDWRRRCVSCSQCFSLKGKCGGSERTVLKLNRKVK
jgi:hypothetical protein